MSCDSCHLQKSNKIKVFILAVHRLRLDLMPREALERAQHMSKDGKVLFPIAPVDEPGKVWGFDAQEWKDNQRRYAEQLLDGCPVRTSNAVSYRLLSQVLISISVQWFGRKLCEKAYFSVDVTYRRLPFHQSLQIPDYLAQGISTTTPIEDLASRQTTAKHLAAATEMPEVSLEAAGMVAVALNGQLIVKTAIMHTVLNWLVGSCSGRVSPGTAKLELRETFDTMLAQSVVTVAIQSATRLFRPSTLRYV